MYKCHISLIDLFFSKLVFVQITVYIYHFSCQYLLVLLWNTEKINLKSASEYKYLGQSNCYSINGVDDAERFRVVTVQYSLLSFMLLSLIYFSLLLYWEMRIGVLLCMATSFCLLPIFRKLWILFMSARKTKTVYLQCLQLYYGWETSHSSLLIMKIMLNLWLMKVRVFQKVLCELWCKCWRFSCSEIFFLSCYLILLCQCHIFCKINFFIKKVQYKEIAANFVDQA